VPLRIMAVDFDTATLELIQDVLCLHKVQVYRDGVQAVAPIVEEKFDGFLLEMNMPNLDGYRLAQWIRQSSRNGRSPIIHMSAQSDPQIMHRSFAAGGTFFLVKPLDRGRLLRLFRSTSGIMLQERRRYWRIPLSVPSHCTVGSRELSGCAIRNLSATGMLLRGDGTLYPGAKVYLAFSLSPSDRSMVSAWGKVVRVDDRGQAGVSFTRINPVDHRRILERIATESDAA
jgi:two-component system, chemotaxis family, chemotaxis protein CheY